ncbi:hypothetical protein B5F32_05390 [Parabacteroides distasonis]|uniref:Polysaccharide pyruvyl transferase domain-containing protein n=1 Tax=Parabacteroides distasonis TaxID=823 RepID=A0A1Y4IRW0_PARDI|nr:polysaccharide pyruvyl transferase family protein [Parabacteroides distasonis]OUP21239.1 hypothetical protein B5F32_05390 [Parabacteroides distasonis]
MGKVVGILSMQRVLNYGSFLQAYALKQLLLQNGADEVYFIDIEKGRSLPGYELNKSIWGKLKLALSFLFAGCLFSKLRDRKFIKQVTNSIASQFPILGLDNPVPSHFDVVFIGSDEVFNCCQKSTWGYTSQLYGRIPQTERVASYAGSFGHTTYGQLHEVGVVGEIGDTMKKLSGISVRDRNSYEIVERLTGIRPDIHLDPVLIYGYKEEIAERNINASKPYMVIYSYQGRISDKNEIKEIVSFAKSEELRLISIFCRYDWCDEAVIPETPFDVLAWFKGAEYVVTDTFHGTIFSIITHRPFCSLIRDSNGQKMASLLEQLSLDGRKVLGYDIQKIKSILNVPVNYEMVDGVLQSERKRAIMYIREQLGITTESSAL